MTEQWQELKETITEMRDNDGTGTQQEVCKFLTNYMEILEKQMQEPCEDVISRQAVLDLCDSKDPDYKVIHFKEDVECLSSVNPTKTGYWTETETDDPYWYRCSRCNRRIDDRENYCPSCGARMTESEGINE